MIADFAPAETIWFGWPSARAPWGAAFDAARAEFATAINAFIGATAPFEPVVVVAADASSAEAARAALSAEAEVVEIPFGDVWLCDLTPLPTRKGWVAPRFNGWGGKFVYPGDADFGSALARRLDLALTPLDLVLEGGALTTDGEGTVLTTRACVLNPNRNPGLSEAEAETRLAAALDLQQILWLDDGLAWDETDGHIDNLARFVAPGRIAVAQAFGEDDPNAGVYAAAWERLSAARDARGRRLELIAIPSPGRRLGADGAPVAASAMNFVVGVHRVLVPLYGAASDTAALDAIGAAFPDHDVVGARADAILTGGGAFHCASFRLPKGF